MIWSRAPLSGGPEELLAHQGELLLEEDRMTVTLSVTEDRQASRIQVRQLQLEL